MRNASRWMIRLAFVIGIESLQAAALAEAPPDAQGTVWFTRVVVHDEMDNRDAFSLFIPRGWQIDARIGWRYDPFYPVASLITVRNPRGPEAVVQYPMLNFNDGIRQAAMRTATVAGPAAVARMAQLYADGNHYLGAEIRPQPASPEAYYRDYLVPRFRTGLANARLVSSQDEPKLAEVALEQMGRPPGLTISASRLHLEYQTSREEVEEDFIVILGRLPLPGGTTSWSGFGCSYRARRGELAAVMPILRVIQDSPRINLPWFNDIEQAKGIMQQIQVNELNQAMIRSRIISSLQEHVTKDIEEVFLHREKVQSSCNDQWDHVIRGSQTVPDPNHPGMKVHVPVGYDHVYISGDGTQYIATNDAHFKPDSVNGNFQELQVH